MQLLARIPKRTFNAIGFLACAGLLGYAYYSQFIDGLEPCPLCIFQRVAVIVLGLLFAIAAVHGAGKTGSRVYAGLVALAAAAGAGIAGWHVRLQNLPPDQVPECGPGLDYMLDVFPLTETLRRVFTASGECADINWNFLGISMPAWVLIWFIGLGVIGVLRNWTQD